MKQFLLLVGCVSFIFALGSCLIFVGSYLLGRPLSKGCGRTDCCRKTGCDQKNKQNCGKKDSSE